MLILSKKELLSENVTEWSLDLKSLHARVSPYVRYHKGYNYRTHANDWFVLRCLLLTACGYHLCSSMVIDPIFISLCVGESFVLATYIDVFIRRLFG